MNPSKAIWDQLGKALNGGGTSRPWLVPDQEVEKPSTGDSTLGDIHHAPSIHCTDWQLLWPNKILTLKKERLSRKKYIDSKERTTAKKEKILTL